MIKALIKNLPSDAKKEELELFLSEKIKCKILSCSGGLAILKLENWKSFRYFNNLSRKEKQFAGIGLRLCFFEETKDRDIWDKRRRRRGHFSP